MKLLVQELVFILMLLYSGSAFGQIQKLEDGTVVDVVWLRDGSKLSGTILKWDLARGMEFKLITGAVMNIPKRDIRRVMQDIPLVEGSVKEPISYTSEPKVYAFKEKGWYQNTSAFINYSSNGGAGIDHVMGYRFTRLLGVGIGSGVETHDFHNVRNIIPVYAEVRGFLLPQKISPYYALKIGYGIALKDESRYTIRATGGFQFSPELGVRFGAGDVCYYLGLEYKLQNATFVSQNFDWGGPTYTDEISYRRIEFRTGLLF